ncbi:MAG: HAMP domain-containing sensor histidine kinase [bacterium]|nr:HAMP domain-containing sensor histidine kinase [bacterium]
MYRSLKGYIIFAGLAVIAIFLAYSQYVFRELEKESETISRVYGRFCASATEDETSVIFDEIVTKINFPVIVTAPDGAIIAARNVKFTTPSVISALDRVHNPVKIEYQGKILALVHYGSSHTRNLLKLAPFAEISLGLLLIAIGIIWLYTLKRSEENASFAGMAKETAHQLGTPISSLMGWKELIKDEKIKSALSEDLERLSWVATRFHKIGSPPEFKSQPVDEVIKSAVEYIKDRISKKVKIVEDYSSDSQLNLDSELFSWAIENLIKNSLDAGSTEIKISTHTNKHFKVLVKDNGVGVYGKLRKKLFAPGHTTKEYGWGIGLSLTKRIVRMHRGKIFYRPNKGENGASFTILLPLK